MRAAAAATAAKPGEPEGGPADPAAGPGALLGTFVVTCYDTSGTTASGAPAGPESVAVDPAVVPLGTRMYIAGVGVRVAQDTGGAIYGDRLDIWEPTYGACATWGAERREVWTVGGSAGASLP